MSSSSRLPIAVLDAALDEASSVDPIYLTTGERQSAMVDLSRVIARAQALLMRVVAASDDVADVTGARSTAAWLAVQTRESHGPAVRSSKRR